MPLPSPKTVAELQEFAESSEGLGNPGQNAWQSFWSQARSRHGFPRSYGLAYSPISSRKIRLCW